MYVRRTPTGCFKLTANLRTVLGKNEQVLISLKKIESLNFLGCVRVFLEVGVVVEVREERQEEGAVRADVVGESPAKKKNRVEAL